ncbi:MAG: single-stranded-DNA-specific exonuclease RecJ [Bacteroidota bacterium]
MYTQTQWKLKEAVHTEKIPDLIAALSTSHSFPESLASILTQRDILNKDSAKLFFAPESSDLHDPYLMKGMEKAVERIHQAFTEGEHILLFGDYDVDGTSSVALMSLFFQEWGIPHDFYIPDRYAEGYGVSILGIDYAEQKDTSLIISLDCGIKAIGQVDYAKEKGMSFIVCDHHRPGDQTPAADAILDPKQVDCTYPYKELSGCGVALKLTTALHEKWTSLGFEPNTKGFHPFRGLCDLATLSIACDIVPLTGENRIIAHFGIKKLQENPLPGIRAIMNLDRNSRSWDISDLVFFVGPRINSAGRLGSGKDAVEVLLGNDHFLLEQVKDLDDSNSLRKQLDEQTTREAIELVEKEEGFMEKRSTVAYHPGWQKGIIGIVASRLIERYYKPTVLFSKSGDKLVGSARSVKGFSVYEALEACSDHILQFGGHKYAAGLTIEEKNLEAFRNCFEKVVSERILPEQTVPVLYVDHLLRFSEINSRFIRLVNRMGPFGPQNNKPVFVSEQVKVVAYDVLKEKHIKFLLEQDEVRWKGIAFNFAEKWNDIQTQDVHVAFQPVFNTWRDRTQINLNIKDIKPAHDTWYEHQ